MTATTLAAPAAASPPRRTLSELVDGENRRARRRRVMKWATLALVPVVVAGLWLTLQPKPVAMGARFRTQPVTRGDIVREVSATGHLEAVTAVQVGAEISGRIATVEVDFNDVVKEGQVLARFDRAALEAQRAQAAASLAGAKATLEQAKTDRDRVATDLGRVERLWAERSISASDHDNAVAAVKLNEQRVSAAEAQLAAQQATYSVSRTNLDHTVIHAPISGVVISRNIDPGQTVAAMFQTPVLFVVAADLRKMRVVTAVDEADIGEVHEAQRATFTVNAYPNRVFEGVVSEVRSSPVIVQDIVTYGTVVDVDNLDLVLKPGMTASVRIRTNTAHDVLRVPAAALELTPPGEKSTTVPGVWILENGALRRLAVTAGVSDGELTTVDGGGLAADREVVVELSPAGRKAYGLVH